MAVCVVYRVVGCGSHSLSVRVCSSMYPESLWGPRRVGSPGVWRLGVVAAGTGVAISVEC